MGNSTRLARWSECIAAPETMVHMGGFRISPQGLASSIGPGAMLWLPPGSFGDVMNGKGVEAFTR
jgi:hypothetical protein